MGALIDEGTCSACSATSTAVSLRVRSVAFGGGQALEETGGYYVEATVLDGVRPEMRVSREEIFGPVLSVLELR